MTRIEEQVSMECQAYLKLNVDKNAVFFYDDKLRINTLYTFDSKRGKIGITLEKSKSVRVDNKTVSVYKYNFIWID